MCCICNYFWLKVFFKYGLFSPSQFSCRMASVERPDVLKIFMGNLLPDVNKPKLMDFFARFQLFPTEVIVPAPRDDRMAVAFIVFGSPAAAQAALHYCNGLAVPEITSCNINAHKNAIVEAFTSG